MAGRRAWAGPSLIEQCSKQVDYSTGDAETQARKYIDDVRRKFKDDDRAKRCKRDADGYPIFRPVGETYTACRP